MECEDWGSCDCSDHEMVEFRILQGRRRAKSRIATLSFRRADFGLLWDPSGRILWDTVPKRRSIQEELVDFQKSPPSSRLVHPDKQEVKQRWQEACIDEQEAAD